MNDIFNSIAKWFQEKTSSPLYGTFLFSVILWNWKFFYVLFWQSEEKFLLPRIEYVQINILNQESFSHHFSYFLVLPLISTFIILFWLPILSNWAHKKHTYFYFGRKLNFIKERLDYEKKEKDILQLISDIKDEQVKIKEEIEKHTTEQEKWEEEFKLLKRNKLYPKLIQLKNVIYSNSGNTHKIQLHGRYEPIIELDVLAFADTNHLIIITGEDISTKIQLTDKGRFFLGKFLADNNQRYI